MNSPEVSTTRGSHTVAMRYPFNLVQLPEGNNQVKFAKEEN